MSGIYGINGMVVPAILISSFLFSGCTRMSETIRDQSAGMNGGFEIVASGLPVNWLLYTPGTIPTGDYDLIIDTNDFKEGRQSLQFFVRNCSANGGWHSPGFSQQYDAIPGKKYKISFWVKNSGCEFIARIGCVSAFEGEYETVIRTDVKIMEWEKYEYQYTMPEDKKFDNIRFELNILQPGTFWIDDIRIEDAEGSLLSPAAG